MSRCFPFPPPGYEKKITATASDLLKKEKHKEKKHKKEKRDKEKREDKEKKDRDRSDGKNREKKDKKDKHRDKKKEKARDKDRQTDNPSTSGETRLKVLSEGGDVQIVNQKNSDMCILLDNSTTSGMAVGYNEENHGRYTSLSHQSNGVKFVHDLDRRIRDDRKTAGGQTGERITLMHHNRNEGVGMLYPNNHLANNFKDSDLAMELDRRLKDEAEQPYDQNQTTNKLTGAHRKKDGGAVKSVSLGTMERGDNKMKGASVGYIQANSTGITMVTNVSVPAQSNHDRMQRPSLGITSEKKVEGRERVNIQEDELQQRRKKRKDKDRNGEKKSHAKDKSRENERKEDKGINRADQIRAEQGTRESHKMDIICAPEHEMLLAGGYNKSNLPKEVKLNQAKEHLTNGIYHVTGPAKLSRSSSIHLLNENGRAPEPRQILVKPSPDRQGATNNFKVEVGKLNGVIDTLARRPATEQVAQALPPSPHPDAKRLNEILSVPKIEVLSELGDSDWLFISEEKREKKRKVDDSRAGTSTDTPQVWSKATNIGSADVYALPYVIPY